LPTRVGDGAGLAANTIIRIRLGFFNHNLDTSEMIYKLYGLTKEEIQTIENSCELGKKTLTKQDK
jgi:hypothetical protein